MPIPLILALYKKPSPDSPEFLFNNAHVLPDSWTYAEFREHLIRVYPADMHNLIKIIPGASLSTFPDLLEDLHVQA